MRLILLFLFFGLLTQVSGQISVDFTGYDGSGITSPMPGSPAIIGGQLNGAIFTTNASGTDTGRGQSSGAVGTGGIYAFEVAPGNVALGVQPTGSDFTPGFIDLAVVNNVGNDVTATDNVVISYVIYTFNDQPRANSWNLEISTDGTNYIQQPLADFTTPGAGASSPVWVATPQTITISGLTIPQGGTLNVRFTTDDVSGSGARDQIAVDDIDVVFSVLLPVTLESLTAEATAKAATVKWATSSESGSSHFEVERSTDGRNFFPVGRVESMGNYEGLTNYDFVDETVTSGVNYYRLRQVDFDGGFEYFGPVTVNVAGAQLTAFPNPAAGELFVRGAAEEATATVLDLNGRVLDSRPLLGGAVDVSALRAGTYLLRVETVKGVETLRFIRQ